MSWVLTYEAICVNYKYNNMTLMPNTSVDYMKLSKSKERFIMYDVLEAEIVVKIIESIRTENDL